MPRVLLFVVTFQFVALIIVLCAFGVVTHSMQRQLDALQTSEISNNELTIEYDLILTVITRGDLMVV